MPDSHPTTRERRGVLARWRAMPALKRSGIQILVCGLGLVGLTTWGLLDGLLGGVETVLYPLAGAFAIVTGLGLTLLGSSRAGIEVEDKADSGNDKDVPDNPWADFYRWLSGGEPPTRSLVVAWLGIGLLVGIVVHLIRPLTLEAAATGFGVLSLLYWWILCFFWAAIVGYRRRRAHGASAQPRNSVTSD